MPPRDGTKHHSAGDTEQLPPQLAGQLKPFRPEGFHLKTRAPQGFSRSSHRRARFRSHRRAAVVFEVANAHALQLIVPGPAQRHRRRRGIAIVGALHDFKQNFQVAHISGHGSDHAQQREGPDRDREVSGCRDASGSGFQSADSAEVRGHANRSAAVAAHASGGHAGRNRRRLPATRSARRAREVPGIIGPPVKKIVRLPGHEQLRRIGNAKNDGAGLAQTRHQRGIPLAHHARPQFRPSLPGQARDFHRTLDAERDPVQHAELFALAHRRLRRSGLPSRPFGIDLHKCVQPGIQLFDPGKMRFHQLNR